MKINEGNKSAFDFYEATYDKMASEISPFSLNFSKKWGYFRLYQKGKYFISSNDRIFTEKAMFFVHENSPAFTEIIQNFVFEKPFFCFSPPNIKGDAILNLIDDSGWGRQIIVYHRYETYIDCVSFSTNPNEDFFFHFAKQNACLFEKLYLLTREKINALVPFDQPGIFGQLRNGGDITYRPREETLSLPQLEKKIHLLLDDLWRKKLSLTSREWEVCKGLARGETAKETAHVLGVKFRTVQAHLDRMYLKLSKQMGYKPTRAQVIQLLRSTIDSDFITRTLWDPTLSE